jgi:hypothetical protein
VRGGGGGGECGSHGLGETLNGTLDCDVGGIEQERKFRLVGASLDDIVALVGGVIGVGYHLARSNPRRLVVMQGTMPLS